MTCEHLSDVRLSELGLCGEATAGNADAAHLASCPECAKKLEEERRLSAALFEMAKASPPPASFTVRTRARFEREMRSRSYRRIAEISAGLLLAMTVWAAFALSALDVLAVDVMEQLAVAVTLCRAVLTITESAPTASALGYVALASALLLAGGALFALFRGPREHTRLY